MTTDTTTPSASPPPDGERNPLAQLCDIVRYAPIAVVLDGPSLLPQLAEQGKAHVRNAQFIGRMALRQGEARLRQQVDDLGPRVVDALRLVGLAPEAPVDDGTDAVASPAPQVPVVDDEPETPAGPPPPAPDELAIPDYESLSASQVVNRLPGLADDELEAVRRYEAAHRGRKTILNKVAQLQA
jgi:hypothetical protein